MSAENILLDENGNANIADWGISTFHSDNEDAMRPRTLPLGTRE